MSIVNIIIGLMGGLGMFLYGMKLMGDGLENASGEKLKVFFEKITSNPVKGIMTGALVTAVIQSSSATTVMVVGFVNAGLMNLYQAAAVIMGANIGTTITAQIIAFKLDAIAPIFIGVGAGIVLFSKAKKSREIGNIILGFGILFSGMELMKTAMEPIAASPAFVSLMGTLKGNIFLGVLTGLLMTAVVQSSSATTAILIALASTGSVPLEAAVPILFGNNIGTCVTALLSSVGTSKTAKKAALIHLFFNLIGTLIFLPFTHPFVGLVKSITPVGGEVVKRQIANAHTVFNIANTIIMLPFIKYLVALVNRIIPGEDEKEPMKPKYIDDRLLETPVIAVGQTTKELIRMANKAKDNLQISMDAFKNNDETLVKKVYKNEKLINLLEDEITVFLVKLSKEELSEEQLDIVTSMFHMVNDIERIGDHAENVVDLASEKIQKGIKFSKVAEAELQGMYNEIINALNGSIESIENRDIETAKNVLSIEERIDSMEKQLRASHIKRLNEEVCNATGGAIFLDIISNFERIGDHSTNLAQAVLNMYK
ncbi:Na/Pi cotransporter family protein [Haloimpatiens massiliensis]|uniref:Na/Pi cotransporter family protein n=1 Tax=Haloimpatiens massiliensis TaxID=1658110 RepID=UPI000C851E40|nr:Na/Pi cotransporter family protein [Haloimpatiens massiliensis]